MFFPTTKDIQKIQDLNVIAAHISKNYISANDSLPQNLDDLGQLHLHNTISAYTYRTISNPEDAGITPSYDLCATFTLPGTDTSGFSAHHRGKQCYQIDYYQNHGSADITPLHN